MSVRLYEDKKLRFVRVTLVLLLLSGCSGGGGSSSGSGNPVLPQNPPDYNPNALLAPPRSENAFDNYMLEGLRQWGGVSDKSSWLRKARYRGSPVVNVLGLQLQMDSVSTAGATGATGAADQSGGTFSGTSETNVIVAGVDEVDSARFDGEHVYLANQDHLQVLRTHADAPAEIVKTLNLFDADGPNGSKGLYLYTSGAEGRLVNIRVRGTRNWSSGWFAPWYWSGMTGLDFVDVSTPANATISDRIEVDGSYINSRRVGEKLYLITRYSPAVDGLVQFATTAADKTHNRQLINNLDRDRILPRVHFAGGTAVPLVSAADCWIPNDDSADAVYYPTVTTITAFDMRDPTSFSSICFADGVDGIHVSQNAIYFSALSRRAIAVDVLTVSSTNTTTDETIIHKIAIDGTRPRYVGSGTVTGSFWGDPAFLMGEHDGYLTAITSTWTSNSEEHRLSILGPSGKAYELKVMGHIPNNNRPGKIGKPNEQIYAARIMGNRAYVVTYKKIDPVYVIDLANPADPRIIGEVEIPGFSSYLHPVSEDLVIGVGKNTDDQGSFAWFQGVSLRLFDVSNPGSIEVAADIGIGRRPSDTSVRWDHHAFTILGDNGIHHIAIPVNVYGAHVEEVQNDPSHYYPWTEDALYLYQLNEAAKTLTFVGKIVAQDETTGRRNQPNCCNWSARSFMNGDTVHFLNNTRLFTANWHTPSEIVSTFIPTMFSGETTVACDTSARESIHIYARDRNTDASISCETFTVEGIEGTFRESCSGYPQARFYETPGVFALTVNAEGFLPWHTTDVHVQRDDCHVGTVRIEVPMTHP